MVSNVEKYKKDLGSLIERGDFLVWGISRATDREVFDGRVEKQLGEKAPGFIKRVPHFKEKYQAWYSEAKALVRQLLPDRVEDFSRLYEKPKSRKEITYENYSIEDALQGVEVNVVRGYHKEKVVGMEAAIPRVEQQVAIVRGVKDRFESSLFDIRQLVQADLFDSELEAASHLLKNKFSRAAGAIAGVVLERHLGEVSSNHGVSITKKNPTVADYNEALKAAGVIDTVQWRFIQHLGDIRNLCDHKKTADPTDDQVQDLLTGVAKVIKTVL